MKLKHIIIAILVIVGVATLSCSKKKLNKKLEGKWERIVFDTLKSSYGDYKEYWTFEDKTITIMQKTDSGLITLDEGAYTLKIKLETKEFIAKGFGERAYDAQAIYRKNFYNTKWIIDKLDDDVMGIYADKDNNLLFYDFIKVE